VPDPFLPSGAAEALGGGLGLLGDGVESASCETGVDVDALRATRGTRGGLDCGSFLG
jgi:hypothetical protein